LKEGWWFSIVKEFILEKAFQFYYLFKERLSQSIKERKVKSDKLTDYCFTPFTEIITSSKKNIIFGINKREKVKDNIYYSGT
jgi:hypothetical protein